MTSKPFLARILREPSYGYEREGRLYVPTSRELWAEYRARINVLSDRRGWLPLWSQLSTLALLPFAAVFFLKYFTVPRLLAGIAYNLFLNVHGTAYLHRYGTHSAFKTSSRFALFILRNLSIKIVCEEIFVISHHVHHALAEKPGDPYNARAGWLYCFIADVNHQTLRKDLSCEDYARVAGLLSHCGLRANTYEQYLKWGSVTNPGRLLAHTALNWAFWFGALSLAGGPGLACAIFGLSSLWAISIRNFNFKSHGSGRDLRRAGVDFNVGDRSVNLALAGFSAGEWHGNHHLYPRSARAGFLPWQPDISFLFVRALKGAGLVESYVDHRSDFFREYYEPYLSRQFEGVHGESSP
jgi:stearoyl-CoA desaturase (delta-9 desaturase)